MDATLQEIERMNNLPMTVYNPMNISFVHSWGGSPYTLQPKSFTRLPAFIARHLAEHLAKYMLNHVEHRLMDKVLPDGKRIPHVLSKKELLEYSQNLLNREGDADVLGGTGVTEMEAPSPEEKIEVEKLEPRAKDEDFEEAVRRAAAVEEGAPKEMEVPEEEEESSDGPENLDEPEDETAIPESLKTPEHEAAVAPRRRGRPAKA